LNDKGRVCDTRAAEDLFANFDVLNVGSTVADRTHDDVDRRRRVNDG
jgi:hypothetical protein